MKKDTAQIHAAAALLEGDARIQRTWCYVLAPGAFDVAPHSCGRHDAQWSEFQGNLWCARCKVDFVPEHNGIFDGPIPMASAALMGVVFDRFDIASETRDRFDILAGCYESECEREST